MRVAKYLPPFLFIVTLLFISCRKKVDCIYIKDSISSEIKSETLNNACDSLMRLNHNGDNSLFFYLTDEWDNDFNPRKAGNLVLHKGSAENGVVVFIDPALKKYDIYFSDSLKTSALFNNRFAFSESIHKAINAGNTDAFFQSVIDAFKINF